MATIRMGIIGCGNFMGHHIPRLLDMDEVKIVGLADPSPDSIARMKERFPGVADVPEFSSHRDLLREAIPDAVEIASPHSFHFEHIVDALNAGCNVLTEKPLVCTPAEGEDVLVCRDRAGKILLVSYQRHYVSIYRYIREQIASGAIGRIQFVTGLQNHGWYWEQRGQWRQDPKFSGGGQLIDWGSHLMDFVMYATGQRITGVLAYENRYDLEVDVDMSISARFEDGAIGSFMHIGNAATPSGEDLGFYGSDGTLLVRSGDYSVGGQLVQYDAKSQKVEIPELLAESTPDRNFVDAILGQDEVHSTGENGLAVLRVNEACWESARTGREAVVNWPDPGGRREPSATVGGHTLKGTARTRGLKSE